MTKAANLSTWTLAALVIGSLGYAAACGSSSKLRGPSSPGTPKVKPELEEGRGDREENDGEEEVVDDESPAPNENQVNLAMIDSMVRFKRNNELEKSFLKLTQVGMAEVLESIRISIVPRPPQTPAQAQTLVAAQAKYDGLFGQLATGETPAEQTPAVVAASTKLAAHYCDAMLKNAAIAAQVLPGVTFAAGAALDNAKAAEAIIKAFWTMGLESSPDMTESVSGLSSLLGELRTSAPAATSQSLLLGACTAALTSAPVTMH